MTLAGLLMQVRSRLDRGVDLPIVGLQVSLKISRRSSPEEAELRVLSSTIRRIATLFPDVKRFVHPSADLDPSTCVALLDFLHDYLPLIYKNARETQLRRLLVRLRDRVRDEDYRQQVTLEIAKSDLRSGIPERATALLNHPTESEIASLLRREIDVFEQRYAARAGLITSLDVWRSIPGDVRGQSLVAYFKAEAGSLRGKSVLHIAPESALRQWLEAESPKLGVRYVTLDPFSSQVDLREDLTQLNLGDETFDVVICHRVLEHILDDAAALREIHRVLKPSGILNFSVPQSVNLDSTNEWIIPDSSHDHHVRQYGNDLDQRLRKAGFAEIKVDRFLLDRTRDQHLAEGTYPLRLYLCVKAPGPVPGQ